MIAYNEAWTYCMTWQLSVSIAKCQTLNIGSTRLTQSNYQYYIGHERLPNVESVVDLGITVDGALKFTSHIANIARKASTRCFLISKCFLSKDSASLVRAFKTFVRPLLEYNSPVWSPYLQKDINLIERVQRRFTKRLAGMEGYSYDERLQALKLERLEARRMRTDIITAYKIIFGFIETPCSDFFTFTDSRTRGHRYKLLMPVCRCDTRLHSFAARVVPLWNDLPVELTNFNNLHDFKNSLTDSYFDSRCTGDR